MKYALGVPLGIMGDVRRAERDLGGGVVEGGRSTVTFGSGDGYRDGVASDE